MAFDFDALANGPCAALFGEAVVYAPALGASQPATGVFDAAYLPVMPLGDVGNDIGMPAQITERRPMLGVRLSQFAVPPAQDDTVTIRGVRYVVREVQADGQGWAKLLLNVAP